jgi:D-glycero-alpha-D-manno-heptose-7-phosphate kinase
MTPLRTLHAAAPIRICDNGGWTDTWFAQHGLVVNIAVEPLVHVSVDVYPAGSREAPVVIAAHNYGVRYPVAPNAGTWGPHPLLEAAFREIAPPPRADIEVAIRSEAPAGAATGTSAAVLVALLGALDALAGGRRSPSAIAAAAHRVETVHLGRQCGVQDQLASAFGGVNVIEITRYPETTVTPLPLPDGMLHALQRRLALLYLGRPHSSSSIHELVVKDLERAGPHCPQLNDLRETAARARDAFLACDLEALGRAMRDNTSAQAALHPDLVHRDAWRAIEIAAAHGASGWKVNGAGGDGGSLAILAGAEGPTASDIVGAALADNPRLRHVPIAVSREGLRIRE